MERKEFITLMGGGAAALMLASCLGACQKGDTGSSSTAAPQNVDFTIDLSSSSYTKLNTNGNYVYVNGILVARTINGDFIAVSQICTHEHFNVVFDSASTRFYCPTHGSVFSSSGAVQTGPASRALTTYHTSLSGTVLRVYS